MAPRLLSEFSNSKLLAGTLGEHSSNDDHEICASLAIKVPGAVNEEASEFFAAKCWGKVHPRAEATTIFCGLGSLKAAGERASGRGPARAFAFS